MSDLHELLDRRVRAVHPSMFALDEVIRRARRRTRRRRVVATGAAVAVAATLMTGVLDSPLPGTLAGSAQALAVRQNLGIFGSTKDAGNSVVVRNKSAQGEPQIALLTVDSKTTKPVQIEEVKDAVVSPKADVVAAVTKDDGVVVVNSKSGATSQVIEPGPQPSPPSISWDRSGNALFALVSGHWLEIRNPGSARAQTRELQIPILPGEPTLLSTSPSGTKALLFGVVEGPGGGTPRLFLGSFDGTTVSGVRAIDVPRGALGGPMGWVGENAFLLAPSPGQALIVRTDGTRVPVYARGIPDPCANATSRCVYRGPHLLGTNDDGSLLFWKVAAVRTGTGIVATFLVRYYRTWLDGTHAFRLTGLTGRYGPAVAPR
jgi:hypothetical protein